MLTRKTLSALLVLVTAGSIYTAYGIKITSAAGKLTTQDYIDIEQNYAKYYHTIDAGDPEGWADTFTDDGNFNGTIGRAALIESRRRAGPSKTRHVVSNLVITPTTEGADGSLYVFIVDPQEVPVKINSYSRYDDTLVKTSKGWRFKSKMRSSDTTIGSRTPQ
jgi:SnoaL-like protein